MNNAPAVNEKLEVPEVTPDTRYGIQVNPETLLHKAIESKAPIDVMERLFDLRDRIRAEAAEIAFRHAMSAFQGECPIVEKSTGVDYTAKSGARVKYQYASIDEIVKSVREILTKHGFSYTFTTAQESNAITVTCHIHHSLGHTEATSFTVPIDPEDRMKAAQRVASSLTYAKRYAFCNGFGIMTGDEDDDAATSSEAPPARPAPPPAANPPVQKTAAPPARVRGKFDDLKQRIQAAHELGDSKGKNAIMKEARESLCQEDIRAFVSFANGLKKEAAK